MKTLLSLLLASLLAGCSAPRTKTADEMPFAPGQILTLSNASYGVPTEPVWVFRDVSAREEGLKYAGASDQTGLSLLFLSGKAFAVEPGTRARVLQYDGDLEVRIESGEHDGSKGYVFPRAATRLAN